MAPWGVGARLDFWGTARCTLYTLCRFRELRQLRFAKSGCVLTWRPWEIQCSLCCRQLGLAMWPCGILTAISSRVLQTSITIISDKISKCYGCDAFEGTRAVRQNFHAERSLLRRTVAVFSCSHSCPDRMLVADLRSALGKPLTVVVHSPTWIAETWRRFR